MIVRTGRQRGCLAGADDRSARRRSCKREGDARAGIGGKKLRVRDLLTGDCSGIVDAATGDERTRHLSIRSNFRKGLRVDASDRHRRSDHSQLRANVGNCGWRA